MNLQSTALTLSAGVITRPRGEFRTATRGEPLVLDGRSSHQSYLVSACLDEAETWNALAVRNVNDGGHLKIKFFPTRDFMIPLDKLMQFGAHDFLDRWTNPDRPFPYAGYHRFFIPSQGFVRLLEHLWIVPDMVVAPVQLVFDWLKYPLPMQVQTFRFDDQGKIMPMPGQALPLWAEPVPVIMKKSRTKVMATLPPSAEEKKGRVFKKYEVPAVTRAKKKQFS